MDIERIDQHEQHYLYVDRSADLTGEAIAAAMESGFGEVIGFFGEKKITPQSMPVAVYAEMPGPGRKMAFRAGFFVAPKDAARATGTVIAGVIPAGPAARTIHRGAYASLNETHSALWAKMQEDGMTPSMPIWEVYIDDPTTKPAAEVKTEIWRAVG